MSEDPCSLRSNYSLQPRWQNSISDISFSFYIQGSERGSVGYASLQADATHKTLTWSEFYPLDQSRDLRNKGFGTCAMLICLDKLAGDIEGIADYKVIHVLSETSNVWKHRLQKMDINPAQPLDFSEYQKKVQKYCGKNSNKKYARELQSSQ